MKISIITVCRNSGETIRDSIASVASQRYADKEHIIIDGASTDRTLDILQNSPTISKWISETDQGVYFAMNKGLALATGDIIGFLNADDVYHNDRVLDQVAQAFSTADIDACYADLRYVAKDNMNKTVRYWKSRPYTPGLFETGWMPAHPTFFARRKIYQQYGGFDEKFFRQADFELTMRFIEKYKIKTLYIPEVWVNMRIGGLSNNSLKGIIKGNIEAYYACRQNGLDVGMLPFIFRKILSRIPQFFKK